jgi:hypothetical protein
MSLDFLKNLPVKNLVPIFIVTFLMIFVIFVMVEPNMYCEDDGVSLFPKCTIVDSGGTFILGLLIAGVLFLLDMALLYMTLCDLMMPDLASDQD